MIIGGGELTLVEEEKRKPRQKETKNKGLTMPAYQVGSWSWLADCTSKTLGNWKRKKREEKETQSGATAFVLLFLSLFLWLIRARNSHRVYLVKRSRNNRARANTKGAPRKERKVAATSSVVPCLEFSPLDDICFRFSGSTLPLWREQGDSLEHCVCAPASSSSVENRIRRNLKGHDFSADSFILSYPVCCCVEQQ